eukprot:GHUV01018100.1.p1 GENE.GHUV01018100.1~~GHUV01018100.1.p1  ORF type:complete len:564 (+),score=220.22 GHUV01018100.1:880-2571(+)
MPEELSYHPEVMELKESIKALQSEFIDTHKALDAAQQEVKELPQLRSRIKQMEEEKERLQEKVEKAAAQAAGLPDASNYREICVALRQEHDREVAISQQLQAQQQQLERAEASFQQSAGRLRQMQQHLAGQGGANVDAARVLEILQDDVARLRAQVTNRWPRELEARQRRLAAVQDTLNNGINTEGDLQRLFAQEQALKQQIGSIQDHLAAAERARAADRAFLQVRQAQQMSTLVARKKSELSAKLERLQEKRDTLAATLDSSKAAAGGSITGGISDEDWRAKYEQIKSQLPNYKAMKKELSELEAEAFTLSRTVEILQQQENEMKRAVHKQEQKAGVQGYADVQGQLEKISEEKEQVDEAKGAVLQEVSATVEQITASIEQKKVQLAPAIQELRALRTQFQELETVHAEKKAAYESAMGGLEATVSGIETEVSTLKADFEKSAAELDKIRNRVRELEQHVSRIGATGDDEYKRRCQMQLAESEENLSQLRAQQRQAAEQHTHGLRQISMMTDVISLLQLKQQLNDTYFGAAAAASRGLGSAGVGRGLPGMPPQSFNTNVMVL